jgi:hypothetical protein
MKKTFLFLVAIISVGQIFAENKMLVCPRQDEILEAIKTDPNCAADKFLELSAKKVFEVELNYFDTEVVEKIMLDNISNPNWLTKKGIQELRIHKLCLAESCHAMLNKCDTNKNYKEDNAQLLWCEKTAENIFEIEKIKIKTAVLENQRRKTRSAFREKFRAIEARANQYFIPNLISFVKEFKRLTDKVTAFILNPLQ